MSRHIRQHWPVYGLLLQTLYIIMNPGPVHSLLKALLCHD
jgi:hypothetical protein